MIIVNLKSSETLSFDLTDRDGLSAWNEKSQESSFQNDITAIGIVFDSRLFTLPIPKNFETISFEASLIESRKKRFKVTGEMIKCYADDVLIRLIVYWGKKPKMSRVDVIRDLAKEDKPEFKRLMPWQ